MREDEYSLLDNLFQEFDRLYDQETLVADTRELLQATARALVESDLAGAIAEAAKALGPIAASARPEVEKNRAALIAVQPVRERVGAALAAALRSDKI
jgi:hypothetical protein